MSKLPDGERGEELKNYIVTGLLRLMRKVPYERIKVTDIVREAGVSRMTYYRHFKTKSDVLASLIDYIIKDVNPVCHENRRNGDWYRFLADAVRLCRPICFRFEDDHRGRAGTNHFGMS